MVEHRTAVPVVIGSNPIVPFFFQMSKKEEGKGGNRKENILDIGLRS